MNRALFLCQALLFAFCASVTGAGSYAHTYSYDLNDNRTRMDSQASATVTPRVLDFEGTTLPLEVAPLTGAWTLEAGKLVAGGNGGTLSADAAARLALNMGADAAGPFEVKVKPDTSGLTVGGGEMLAGIACAQTANGRYVAGLSIEKVAVDGGGEALKRRLRLIYVSEPSLAVEAVASSEPVDYTNEELTLALVLSADSITTLIEEDQGTSDFTVEAAHGVAGGLGLETRLFVEIRGHLHYCSARHMLRAHAREAPIKM